MRQRRRTPKHSLPPSIEADIPHAAGRDGPGCGGDISVSVLGRETVTARTHAKQSAHRSGGVRAVVLVFAYKLAYEAHPVLRIGRAYPRAAVVKSSAETGLQGNTGALRTSRVTVRRAALTPRISPYHRYKESSAGSVQTMSAPSPRAASPAALTSAAPSPLCLYFPFTATA